MGEREGMGEVSRAREGGRNEERGGGKESQGG